MKSTLTADKIITEKQVKSLLKECQREKDQAAATGKHLKFINDYYLISIGYNVGLRVSELADLKWRDVSDDYLIVRCGKGGKSRTVYFGDRTEKLFQEYKNLQKLSFERKCQPEDPIFQGQRGQLTRTAIHLRIKYWLKRVGLPESLSFHSLRHGFATRLLDNGIPLASVRDQLGHSNISTTSIYLHFTEEARDKIRKVL